MTGRVRRWAVVVALVPALAVTACTGSEPEPRPTPTPTPTATPEPVTLTLGVFGPDNEIDAFRQIAQDFVQDNATVKVVSWPDREAALAAYRSGDPLPDVFLASRGDLLWFMQRKLVRPVDELLDERGVSFGDGYSRDALEAFAEDNALQCMPYAISPMVVYLNTDLVDFDRMARRGLDVPEQLDRWSFDQFVEAARFATRPARGTRGVYVEPTLEQLSPFIYSGGGQVFDDPRTPTSLAFSDAGTQSALERTLTLLRDAQLTPTMRQQARFTPVEMFEAGQVGMITGFRDLVPAFRATAGLNFDVMPMPRLDRDSTVGSILGFCLSADAASTPAAADLMVHLLNAQSVGRVARGGYLVPANVEAATSPDFLQPGRQPANSLVFSDSVRDVQVEPFLDSRAALERAVAPLLRDLVADPVPPDLAVIGQEIDAASQTVLAPPSESPSPTDGTGSPSG